MSGLRRNNSTCGSNQQYEPFMLGRSKGFGVGSQPATLSMNTVSAPAPPSNYNYPAPTRTTSLNNANPSVRDCLYWPASLNHQKNQQYQMQPSSYSSMASYSGKYPSKNSNKAGGDVQMFCQAPPKVYMSVPGMDGKKAQMHPQSIPCQVAPLGTDPMSLIKPLAPLTVKVQAPADLFTGPSDQPKTISISPTQLYGAGVGGRR